MSNSPTVIPASATSPEVTERLCTTATLLHAPGGVHDPENQSLVQMTEQKAKKKKTRSPLPPKQPATAAAAALEEHQITGGGLELYSPLSASAAFKEAPSRDCRPGPLLSADGEEQQSSKSQTLAATSQRQPCATVGHAPSSHPGWCNHISMQTPILEAEEECISWLNPNCFQYKPL